MKSSNIQQGQKMSHRTPTGSPLRIFWLLVSAFCLSPLSAQVPSLLNYQGRVAVNGTNFNGTGLFKFALVNSNGTASFWSNNNTSTNGSEPTAAVSLATTNGLYSVLLGNTALTNMTAVPASVFTTNSDVRLRVWFDGGAGSQLLAPDQRIAAVGYAMMAGGLSSGAVSFAQISGTVADSQLAPNVARLNATSQVFSAAVHFTNSGNSFFGTNFSGNGAGLTNLAGFNGWSLTGNTGIQTNNFLGTTDTNALELRVNNQPAIRIVPQTNSVGTVLPGVAIGSFHSLDGGAYASVIGGGQINSIHDDAYYSTIAGGYSHSIGHNAVNATIGGGFNHAIGGNADNSTIGGGYFNNIDSYSTFVTISGGFNHSVGFAADYATISGGDSHSIGDGALWATISGGFSHSIVEYANYATISGGDSHSIGLNADWATISGGSSHIIGPGAQNATIAGGYGHSIGSNSSFSLIGGGQGNSIGLDAENATIAGGYGHSIGSNADGSTIGGGFSHSIGPDAQSATIAGGYGHSIGSNSSFSLIGGGQGNSVSDDTTYATMGGGYVNTIGENAHYATVAGGTENSIGADAWYSSIAGGFNNDIHSGAVWSSIGGGGANVLSTNALYSTIGGGQFNHLGASGNATVIGGGFGNETAYGVSYAVIPGGSDNYVNGDYAFAAGHRAKAYHAGAFVWADSQDADFGSGAPDTVSFRCQGGVSFASSSGWATNTNQRVSWNPGAGSWVFLSDRNSKERITPINSVSVLEKLATIPIAEWNYIGYDQRHIGPMAQDFHAQFPLNPDDKTLNDADLHGVALAAIQGLNQKLESELKAKDAEVADLKARLTALEQLLKSSAK